jgi:hypothetical protein
MPPLDVSPVASTTRLSAAPPSSSFLSLELDLSVQTSQSQALGSWHRFAAIYLAAACVSWLRHPRKNRSRSSATPARLSLLGGQLRMLMRRGNVSIVAMTHLALVSQSVSERLGQCTINTANTDSQDLVERTTLGNRSGARTTRGCALGSRIACLSWAQWKHDAPGSCHTHARNLKRSVYCGVRREK